MSKKEVLTPFDLAKAKAGAKLRTKDGYDARIVCYDRYGGNYPIVALVKKEINKEEVCHFFQKKWANGEYGKFII